MNILYHSFKYFRISIFLIVFTIIGCNSSENKEQKRTEGKTESVFADSSVVLENKSAINTPLLIDTLEVIVVQCSNGYEYAMHNYDFNPVIETELNKFSNIKVKPFPLKTLMGVTYQGVFDKKYCPPIIEKVDVDFLILTRFINPYSDINNSINPDSNYTDKDWGYELRVVNTTSLKQVNSINGKNFKDYDQLVLHLKDNISNLKIDIEKFK